MKRVCLLMAGLLLFTALPGLCATIRISIVADGIPPRYPDVMEQLKTEILTLADDEATVSFPDDLQYNGNWDPDQIRTHWETVRNTKQADLIITFGQRISRLAVSEPTVTRPVIAMLLADDSCRNLPGSVCKSGKVSLNSIDVRTRVEEDMEEFQKLAPYEHLVVILDRHLLDTSSRIRDAARKQAAEKGNRITFIPADAGAEDVLERIPASAQAVLVLPLFQFSEPAMKALAKGLVTRKLPSLALWGRRDVESGLLASYTTGNPMDKVIRGTAINVMEIIRNEKTSRLPMEFAAGREFTVNIQTAKAIGISPSWETISDAKFVGYTDAADPSLDLQTAVRETLAANLDLAAAKQAVIAGSETVTAAKSNLLPQILLESSARTIDDDRAAASQGSAPEHLWNGSLSASQVLYADKAWAGFTAAKELQQSRNADLSTTTLDLYLAASTAYLDYLRAGRGVAIRKENLKLTRANLERARVRMAVGQAGPAEVYRWESEIANQTKELLSALSLKTVARTEVNRLRNRPLEDRFRPVEAEAVDPAVVLGDDRIIGYLDRPMEFDSFRSFVSKKAMETAPELLSLSARKKALERTILSAKREYWLPSFRLSGLVDQHLHRDGDGENYSPLLPEEPDDTNWAVMLSARLPLYSGGNRGADIRRIAAEIRQIEATRTAASERINQRVHLALSRLRASYPGIRLARKASDAAAENLSIAINAYERGAIPIIDLLDAQNLAFVADQVATDAVFDFLVDVMSLQRAVGEFFLLSTPESRNRWFDAAAAFTGNS